MFFPAFFCLYLGLIIGDHFLGYISALLLVSACFFLGDWLYSRRYLKQVNRLSLALGYGAAVLFGSFILVKYSPTQPGAEVLSAEVVDYNSFSLVLETGQAEQKYWYDKLFGDKKIRLQVNQYKQLYQHQVSIGQKFKVKCKWQQNQKDNLYRSLNRMRKIIHDCQPQELKLEQSVTWAPLRNSLVSYIEASYAKLRKPTIAHGFVLGDTSEIPLPLLTIFRQMGIAHLFAASGLHVALLFFIVSAPFFLLGYQKTGQLAGLIAAIIFLILLDFRVSLLRAFLFLASYLILQQLHRKTHSLIILFFAATVIEILFPFSSFTLGFILSFAVTFFIIVFFKYFHRIFRPSWGYLRSHSALTLSAFFGSAFLSFIFFDYFHPLSLILNFLLVPLSGIYLTICLLYLVFPPLTHVIYFFDQFFLLFAQYSHQIVLQYFPGSGSWYHLIYLALLYLGLFVIFILGLKNKLVLARRNRNWGLLAIFLCFLPQLFFVTQNIELIKTFPYGVIQIKEKHLSIVGSKASFYDIEKGSLIEPTFLNQGGFKNITAPADFHKALQKKVALPWQSISIPEQQARLPLSISENCFFFSAKLDLTQLHSLKQCNKIYLSLNKQQMNDAAQIEQWRSLFQISGYTGQIHILPFFRWISPRAGP